ncbi:hypothetical protein BC834DRAFT_511342 [Gloeopeniophorella convolvens]|nr:hypothetical protein BC834DRAFT_511342 [Gloeopeniophorella convolvens]
MNGPASPIRPYSGAKPADHTRLPTSPPKTSQSPSYIPLLAPKASRSHVPSSSLPSSLSVPQLGLVAPTRTASGSAPASQPPHTITSPTASQPPSSGGSALPSLRTLRSFLPFGSGKPSNAPGPGPGSALKSPFAGFAPVRRASTTFERKRSGHFSRAEDGDDSPVISITPSPKASPVRVREVSPAREPSPSPPPPPAVPARAHEDESPPVVTFVPEPPLSTELSTILESDLSGLSKHLPALDESRDSNISAVMGSHGKYDELRYGRSPVLEPFPPSPGINEPGATLDPHNTSALDLSISHLKEEVLHALKEKPSRNGWLTGVVVEDAADSRPASRADRLAHDGYVDGEPEESFHLDALDPDLAALLSPNRMTAGPLVTLLPENLLATAPTLSPHLQNPVAAPPPRIFPPSRAVTPLSSRPSPLVPSPGDGSPTSATGSARSQQTSPARPVASQSHPSLARAVPSRFVPRLMRSATDRVMPARGGPSLGSSSSRAASDSALPLEEARRVSSDSYYRRPPVSPLSSDFPTTYPADPPGHTVSSRLATPARYALNAPANSRLLRSAFPSSSASSAGGWGADSPSPSSRTSSAMGSAADRLARPRTSEDGLLEGRPSARERLGYPPRARNRSMSVGGDNDRPPSRAPRPATEWLGPRTAKAFAAAGLLERERDAGASRFASVRSLGDRDTRALAPSRLALSEAGSAASSWRSGSVVSRALTHSDGAALDTASSSTGARDSTAPTSVSFSRSHSRTPSPQHAAAAHAPCQAALRALQDKHATETGTLLAALADAQSTAQTLRGENAQLEARVDELEAQLVSAHSQLRAQQYAAAAASPPPREAPLARSVFSRPERAAPSDTPAWRRTPPVPTPRAQSPRVPIRALEEADAEDATFQPGRRASRSESVFALPPPNMSLLLHEQPAGSRRSVGSVRSVTTAGALTDAPGSPRSLFLRPEHELHLGDMGSLDLRFTEDEAEDDDEG